MKETFVIKVKGKGTGSDSYFRTFEEVTWEHKEDGRTVNGGSFSELRFSDIEHAQKFADYGSAELYLRSNETFWQFGQFYSIEKHFIKQ